MALENIESNDGRDSGKIRFDGNRVSNLEWPLVGVAHIRTTVGLAVSGVAYEPRILAALTRLSHPVKVDNLLSVETLVSKCRLGWGSIRLQLSQRLQILGKRGRFHVANWFFTRFSLISTNISDVRSPVLQLGCVQDRTRVDPSLQ